MLKYTRLAGLVAAGVLAAMWAMPAQAQATRTWISGVGDDVNPCSRTAPCKTFPGAISKTAAGGEIDTLDPGGFGAVTVTKAITLANEGIGEAGILVAGTNGVTVNCSTDPNCVVIIRGLQIDGGPIGSNSLNGVKVIAARETEIFNCQIRNFTGGSPNGFGVYMGNSASSTLDIGDTTFTTNGQSGSVGGGIYIAPTGSATVTKFTVIHVGSINNSGSGLKIDTTGLSGTSTITGSVMDGNLSGNSAGGITINGGTTTTNVTVESSNLSNNAGVGIFVSGSGTNVFLGRSILTGDGQAFAISSGRINTFGDNDAVGNTTGSSPSSPVLSRS